MPSIVVACVGDPGVAAGLGKKGTTSDLTLFNAAQGDRQCVFVEPTRFPEKMVALTTALSMAHRCLLVVHGLTRSVAETVATVDLFDLPTTIVRGPSVGDDEIRRALKGTRLEHDPVQAEDLPRLREMIGDWTAPERPGPVRVPIDHAFQVKGVGAVALGLVAQGRLEAHAKLRLYPTARTVEVRSIQVHDVDRPSAATGERVGVALKGIEARELERGQILAPEGSLPTTERWFGRDPKLCRYYRGSIASGGRYHLAVGLDAYPVQVGPAGGPLDLTVDRPISIDPGAAGYLLDLSATVGPRVVGRWSLDPAGSG
ncbi:MAG: EF-Tu/IF-2/RF-3 family GTPase [Thermoplasmata archaeon]